MLPIKQIVCPTDFSDPSYAGLAAAVELAEHFGSELILLHVVVPMPVLVGAGAPTGFHIPSVITEMEAQATNMLERVKSEKIPEAISSRSIVLVGKPADDIVNTVEKANETVIVIASHGESGWRRFFSGSITERVVRMASCPVIVVPVPDSDVQDDGK